MDKSCENFIIYNVNIIEINVSLPRLCCAQMPQLTNVKYSNGYAIISKKRFCIFLNVEMFFSSFHPYQSILPSLLVKDLDSEISLVIPLTVKIVE